MALILCVDDEPAVGAVVERTLADLGHETLITTSVADALRLLQRRDVDLILSDYRMPGASGLDLLDQLRQEQRAIPVIIMTAFSSIEHAVTSIRRGAVDYLTKPLRAEATRIAVTNALELARLRRENEAYRLELQAQRGARTIIGDSPALRAVLEMVRAVAPTSAPVLLEGESGTGKELLARAIHEQSPRAGEAFITINCAALPEGLVESTLFGHERGAFTGATQRAIGAFERAHRGTLLLDEISEMRLDLQAKLLRALQEKEFERVGGGQTVCVDVRVVATTNRDLEAEVAAGRFRQDLFYRLSVVPIHTPPLRERLEDIPALVEQFVRLSATSLGIRPPTVTPEALAALQRRLWPGNVRQLANLVERAVILHRGPRLDASVFGPADEIAAAGPGTGGAPARPAAAVPEPAVTVAPAVFDLAVLESQAIGAALAHTGGHRAKAARLLGISERTLRNKLNTPRPTES